MTDCRKLDWVHSRLPLVCLTLCLFSSPLCAQTEGDSPRNSLLVQVVGQVKPAVVALFVPEETPGSYSTGSAAIVHPDGYAITNDHVVSRNKGYAIYRGKLSGFQVVGRIAEKDVAVVRLRGVTTPLPVVNIGHSHDVMNGESVLVMGNPGGRGIVVTSGVVSSNRQFFGGMSALMLTQFPDTRRDDFIQFDAASNKGNSGGPLINMEGDLIGIVSRLIPTEQNSSFAIPVDRVRRLLDQVIEPELIHGRSVGLEMNSRADAALVTGVQPGSAAQIAGVQPGDIVASIGGRMIRHAADWTFSLDKSLRKGEVLEVVVKRGGNSLPMTIKPKQISPTAPAEIQADELEAGLAYDFFEGKFDVLPNFDALTPKRSGAIESLDLASMRGERDEMYAIRLNGYFQVDKTGLYRLVLTSDDGSKISVDDQPLIDHDGKHPPMPVSRLIRVQAGLHPIVIEFFQGVGGQTLDLKMVSVESAADEIESGEFEPKFFHKK